MYINSPYTPEPEMYEFIELNSNVTRSDTSKAIVLEPSTYENNIVFIPGGKVMPEAYLYLATELANQGMKVTIIKPIANLAILQPNLGSKYLEEGKTNIVMGHSLGGVVSSMVVSKHPDINYLVLLGSYNLGEIKSTETLIISAEFDIQMDWDTYDENTKSINNLTEVMIEGGNHAYFGYYGNQRGDGEAEMSNKEQQDLVVGYIIDFLE
jgi:hypothetical protein